MGRKLLPQPVKTINKPCSNSSSSEQNEDQNDPRSQVDNPTVRIIQLSQGSSSNQVTSLSEIESSLDNKDLWKNCANDNELSGMIACDKCDQWYHFKCQNIQRRQKESTEWFCKDCKGQTLKGKPIH